MCPQKGANSPRLSAGISIVSCQLTIPKTLPDAWTVQFFSRSGRSFLKARTLTTPPFCLHAHGRRFLSLAGVAVLLFESACPPLRRTMGSQMDHAAMSGAVAHN